MAEDLLTTCLHQEHLALGGRMVPFAGWHMPVQYESIIGEHHAVRRQAGIFDVSHMGRLYFSGAGCGDLLQRVLTCDVSKIDPGHARYALICLEAGGILDDVILYNLGKGEYLLICNAGNTPAVLGWLAQWTQPGQQVAIDNRTAATAMIALQGPQAVAHVNDLLGAANQAVQLKAFQWTESLWRSQPLFVARTGYTGESGFELILGADDAPALWQALVERGVAPCGLGARDTLRLEACFPLHGNDISPETNPAQAGLLWTVALDNGDFIGREAIAQAKDAGTATRLIGFELTQRGVPRSHCDLLSQGQVVGQATSGGHSPTLEKGIGLGYVPAALTKVGTELEVDIRGNRVPARVAQRPFYKRAP